MIPEVVLDEFVMMRLVEILQERKAQEVIKRAVSRWNGNGGCLALHRYAEQLEAIFAKFEDEHSHET